MQPFHILHSIFLLVSYNIMRITWVTDIVHAFPLYWKSMVTMTWTAKPQGASVSKYTSQKPKSQPAMQFEVWDGGSWLRIMAVKFLGSDNSWHISSTPFFSWTIIGRQWIHSTHSTWCVLETAASSALQFPTDIQLWPLKELSKNREWPDYMGYRIGEWVIFMEVCRMAGLDHFNNA